MGTREWIISTFRTTAAETVMLPASRHISMPENMHSGVLFFSVDKRNIG